MAPDSILSAASLFMDAMPELVADSPVATGEFFGKDDSCARQILDVTPRDVGVVCMTEALGYYSGIVPPEQWNNGLMSVGKLLPYVTVIGQTFEEWVDGRIDGVKMGVAAYTFRGDSGRVMWSKNSGRAGKIDEISGRLLLIGQGMVPGSMVVIGRCRESDEEWNEKLAIYSAVAQEIGYGFCAKETWARFQKPMLQLMTTTRAGSIVSARPRDTQEGSTNYEPRSMESGSHQFQFADISSRSEPVAQKKSKFTRKAYRRGSAGPTPSPTADQSSPSERPEPVACG